VSDLPVSHLPVLSPARAGQAARSRIIDAAVRSFVRDGADASMATIASAAGVSKALLHYHYADRASLLAEVVAQLVRRMVNRERAAMDAATGSGAVDALWSWLDGELARGELRALLELGMLREPEVRAACAKAALLRRRAASDTVGRLFASLGLAPRMPAELLGGASVAFMDGLAIDTGRHDPRASFDVFWLALLSLAE
jgi:AcrR family transcriptional regulator